MAANEVEIANMALSHIGADAILVSLSPPDGTIEAGFAARFLPIARRVLLSYYEWGFARKRFKLAPLSVNPSDTWDYAYSLPPDCLKPWRVISPDAKHEQEGAYFVVEAGTLFTDLPQATLIYTRDVRDYGGFPPAFESALSFMLASYLAGPLIKGPEGTQVGAGLRDRALQEASRASMTDANSRGSRNEWEEDWIPEGIRVR